MKFILSSHLAKLIIFPVSQAECLQYFRTKIRCANLRPGREQVYPVYYRKTNKVKPVLIVEFIFCAHGSLKVHYKRHNAKRTNIYSVYLSAGHEKPTL